MASALASQLAGIRSVNAARLATLGSSAGAQHTASYLFPPKTAAAQDLATVHALARTGLEELAAHDRWFENSEWARDAFGPGRELLFGESSKSRDRSVLTKEENAKVDQSLALFLARIAHDITGRSAAKCLEWLVRRFRINEFNVPVLLGAFLPFHTTPQFARMLKICKIEHHPFLAFLQPCQKQESPLPSPLLISALLASPNLSTSNELLRWVTGLILVPKGAGIQPHRTLISFWAATLIQFSLRWADMANGSGAEYGGANLGTVAHNRKGKRRGLENRLDDAQIHLNLILPITVRCAALVPGEDNSELRTAALMVVAALGACFPFSAEAVRATIGSLVGPARAQPADADEQVIMPLLSACIALFTHALSDNDFVSPLLRLGQEQEQAAPLISTDAAQTLLELPRFAESVAKASERGTEVAPFVHEVLAAVTSPQTGALTAPSRTARKLSGILLSPSIDDQLRLEAARYLLALRYDSTGQADEAVSAKHGLRLRLLGDIREQQPQIFDEAVKFVNAGVGEDKAAEEALWTVLKAVITKNFTADGPADADPTATLWLTVHSPSPTQRVLAIRSLYAALADGTLPETDSFVVNALEARLSALTEPDADVVKAVYEQPVRVLAVLGQSGTAELVLGALDAEGAGASLGRQTIEAHLRFFLAHLLSAQESSHAYVPRLVKDVLWGRLLQTKAARKTADAVAAALRMASLPVVATGGAGASRAWIQILQALVAALKKVGGAHEDHHKYNQELAHAIAAEIAKIKDAAQLDEILTFLVGKTEVTSASPSAAQASARVLSLSVLTHLAALIGDERVSLLAERAAHGIQLGPSAEAAGSAEDHLDDLELTLSSATGLADAVYSRPGHDRTLRRLVSVLFAALFAKLALPGGGDEADLLPIGSAKRPVAVGIRLYAFLVAGHFGPQTTETLKRRFWDRLGESVLTFLATIWTASGARLGRAVRGVKADVEIAQMEMLVKRAALQDAQPFLREALIKESTEEGVSSGVKIQDFQTVVPALLLALQDEYKEVRQAALKPLEIIASAQDQASKPEVEFAEYGYDVIYGASSKDLVYLHYADVCKYVRSLLEEKESFANDQQNLAIWHATALSVKKSDKRKDAEYKQAIVAFLLAHVVAWPSTLAGIGLLTSLRDLPHPTKLRTLIPVLRRFLQSEDEIEDDEDGLGAAAEDQRRFVQLLFGAYDVSAPAVVEDKTNGSWALLMDSLKSPSPFVRDCACRAVAGAFFKSLRPDMAQELLQHIVNVLNEAPAGHVAQLRQCLRELPAPATIFGPVLAQVRVKVAGMSESDGREVKRARTSVSHEDVQLRAASTLAVLLETVAARNIKGAAILVGELFEILRTAVEISGSSAVNSDHLMQLSMAALLQVLSPSEKSVQIVQAIRVDTIISTIKVSQNPQTFQQALALLNRIATINQELVLHNVMPIFTFVGSSMLQRDDSYSFEIVQQTLQSIIPAYVQTLRAANQGGSHFDLIRRGRGFMRIFTDAATHIPRHRRQTFFKSLLDVLGPADFLAAICMLLTDRSAHKVTKQTSQAFAESIALPLSLLASFSVDKQVGAIDQVFAEIVRLWQHRAVSTLEARESVFLDRMDRAVREHSDRRAGPTQQLCALMRLVIAATSASSFRTRLAKIKKAEVRAVIDAQLEACVHRTLRLAVVDDGEVRAVSNEVLETLLQHISSEGFMRLVAVLVTDESNTTKRTGLSLFSTRFAMMTVDEKLASEDKVVPVLKVAAKSVSVASTAAEQPEELSEALTSIKVATVAKLTTLHPVLVAAVPDLLKLGQADSLSSALRIEVLTAISRVVRVIGPRLIPHLASIVTFALTVVGQSATHGSGAVLAAAFGVLTSLTVTLPTFMVSYVQVILAALVDSKLLSAMEEPGFENAERPLNTLYNAVVKSVVVEKVLDALQKLWTTHAQAGNVSSLVSVVDCLRRVIVRLDRPAIAGIYKTLFRFFLRIFDTRRLQAAKLDADGIDSIEEAGVQAFIEMALQLNESAFRPLFYHIFDWAVLELAEEDKPVSDPGLRARRILLFKLVNTLLLQLRGLFTTYYATVLDHTIELLTAFAAGELEDATLWHEVITSIELTCQFDEGNFWNPTRLSKISTSLIGQVQVCAGGRDGDEDDEDEEDQASLLASAVAALAQTVSDEDSLKELNDGLLRKTRSGTSSVKAASLLVLDELWTTQAEAMQPFVAQTTPFLAELLDADDAEVLQRTNQLVQTIEGILGEPLDSYLT
ncbi:snoRNA-binding rRNA-processing protein utp10 [Tilletia horrida]|nr:snoRNA-binding rRNA-processing protein utp10 [Tilletia horrida]